jgi:Na+/citrate or Na+/malate symporter
MNWTNFRLRVYQVLKNEEKYNALAQKQEKHQEKLKQKNQKYNWKMLGINILIILAIFTISIILKKLFIY